MTAPETPALHTPDATLPTELWRGLVPLSVRGLAEVGTTAEPIWAPLDQLVELLDRRLASGPAALLAGRIAHPDGWLVRFFAGASSAVPVFLPGLQIPRRHQFDGVEKQLLAWSPPPGDAWYVCTLLKGTRREQLTSLLTDFQVVGRQRIDRRESTTRTAEE